MAGTNGKRGRADRVLESRHLVGLFLGVVVLCGVFFTLGYVMGRTAQGGRVHAALFPTKGANSSPSSSSSTEPPAPVGGQWDFYAGRNGTKSSEARTNFASRPAKSSAAAVATSRTAAATKGMGRFRAPAIPRGAFVLQIAALTREGDALALADALQQKQFPAFVLTPGSDNLFRVQVGPYADADSARLARRALEREGFKPIVRH